MRITDLLWKPLLGQKSTDKEVIFKKFWQSSALQIQAEMAKKLALQIQFPV